MGKLSPERRIFLLKVTPVQNSVTLTLSQATLSLLQETEDMLCACHFVHSHKTSLYIWSPVPR